MTSRGMATHRRTLSMTAALLVWLIIKVALLPAATSWSDHISFRPGISFFVVIALIAVGVYQGRRAIWVVAVLLEAALLGFFLFAAIPATFGAAEAVVLVLQAACLATLGWPSLRENVEVTNGTRT